MSGLPQELTETIEQIVSTKFDELVAAHKLDPTAEATSFHWFQKEWMRQHDGDENLKQGFFRTFLDWFRSFYSYNITDNPQPLLDQAQYITPVDVENPPDCGKIIAPLANLNVEGEGVLPVIPDPSTLTPDHVDFDEATHLMLAGLCQNITDNKWFFRGFKTDAFTEKYGKKYNWYAATKQAKEYGALYNWYAATYSTGGASIAPVGWHLPSNVEWETLRSELGGTTIAGGKLKEAGTEHWKTPNTGADNSSGFTALGSGFRDINGNFTSITVNTHFHSDQEYHDPYENVGPSLSYSNAQMPQLQVHAAEKALGLPIRLLKDDSIDPGTMTDYDENIYNTVKIGTQVWMRENLKVTHYNDGTPIPNITDNAEWAADTDGAMCWYNNIAPGSTSLLPPTGYHLPSLEEMNTLRTTIGGDEGGGKLKETGINHWLIPNTGATDEYGLKLIGSGIRDGTTGLFSQLKTLGSHWTSHEESPDAATHWYVSYSSNLFSPASLHYEGQNKASGLAVRFIKDDDTNDGFVIDYDSNVYSTVKIGDLVIMAENFRCSHYNDGTLIPEITDNDEWISDTEGAMCDYLVEEGSSVEGIYNLQEALSIGIDDINSLEEGIDNLQDALDVLIPGEARTGLSQNNFTDELKDQYDSMVEHLSDEDIHLSPDEETITGAGDVLSIITAAIRSILSAESPLSVGGDGVISLAFNETQFEIVDDKLTIIPPPVPPAALLSFDEETKILTVDPVVGSESVDLSSLAPGATLDLSNYLKKTGYANQTVEGDISITGKLKNF